MGFLLIRGSSQAHNEVIFKEPRRHFASTKSMPEIMIIQVKSFPTSHKVFHMLSLSVAIHGAFFSLRTRSVS